MNNYRYYIVYQASVFGKAGMIWGCIDIYLKRPIITFAQAREIANYIKKHDKQLDVVIVTDWKLLSANNPTWSLRKTK